MNKSKLMNQFTLLIYTIKTIIQTKKALFLSVVLFSMVNGFYPILTLRLTQTIINQIQSMTLSFEEISRNIIIFVSIAIIGVIIANLNSYLINKLSIFISYNMNVKLMRKVSKLPLEDLEKSETYDALTRLEGNIGDKPSQMLSAILGLISAIITFLNAIVVILAWRKSFFFLIIALAIFATWFYLKIASDEFKMLNQRNPLERKSWYYSFLLTHDTGFKEIKTFGLTEYFIKKYQSLVDAFFNQENRINKNKNRLSLIVALLEELISGLVFIIALKSAYDGEILIGTVVLYVNTLAIIQNTTVLFSSNIYSLYNSNLYMDYFKKFMEKTEENSAGTDIGEIDSIQLRNVSFSYYSSNESDISTISLNINKGETIAIIGKNGSGKSTLIKLLTGLYNPNEGEILINGRDLSTINRTSFLNKVSVLYQDFLKYEGSLEENIQIGSVKKEFDKIRAFKLLKKCGADVFETKDGYDFNRNLGNWFENGHELSGGQWQKIALSRAFYRNADLYILDEPSASLDSIAETKVFDLFFEEVKDKIGIYITHNIAYAKKATKIMILNNGKIEAIGTHDDLEKNSCIYRKLIEEQNEGGTENEKEDSFTIRNYIYG